MMMSLSRAEVVKVKVCPAGQYLRREQGVCSDCPAGRYGAVSGLTSAECSGLCEPGCVSMCIHLGTVMYCW